MLAVERRNLILEKLQEEKRVVVSELSQLYNVSEETIRRDLEKLEHEGYAIKSYGGAVINENTSIDMPFNVRKNRNVVGKQKIAELIASMIHDGEAPELTLTLSAPHLSTRSKSSTVLMPPPTVSGINTLRAVSQRISVNSLRPSEDAVIS